MAPVSFTASVPNTTTTVGGDFYPSSTKNSPPGRAASSDNDSLVGSGFHSVFLGNSASGGGSSPVDSTLTGFTSPPGGASSSDQASPVGSGFHVSVSLGSSASGGGSSPNNSTTGEGGDGGGGENFFWSAFEIVMGGGEGDGDGSIYNPMNHPVKQALGTMTVSCGVFLQPPPNISSRGEVLEEIYKLSCVGSFVVALNLFLLACYVRYLQPQAPNWMKAWVKTMQLVTFLIFVLFLLLVAYFFLVAHG